MIKISNSIKILLLDLTQQILWTKFKLTKCMIDLWISDNINFSSWKPSHQSFSLCQVFFRSIRPEAFLEKGVLKICSKFTGEHPCRSVIAIATLLKSHFGMGVAVNLQQIFRGPFPRNTSGWLLLVFEDNKDQVYGQVFKKAFFKKTINVFKKNLLQGFFYSFSILLNMERYHPAQCNIFEKFSHCIKNKVKWKMAAYCFQWTKIILHSILVCLGSFCYFLV